MATLGALHAVTKIVEKYHPIVSACMVDFITGDVFTNISDPNLASELLQMSELELQSLPQLYLNDRAADIDSKYPNVCKFAKELSQHTLEALGVSVTREEFLEKQLSHVDDGQDLLRYFDRFMSDKKMHEVVYMSQVVLEMASSLDTDTILDLGSGKAYLSQVVAAQSKNHNLKLMAVDSSSTNSHSASRRSQKLEKFWGGLIRRAEYRKDEKVPPPRGKHWKSKRGRLDGEVADSQSKNDDKSALGDRLKFVTRFVDTSTDFQALLKDTFDQGAIEKEEEGSNDRMGLIGLHTCGNLAPDSLRIFLSSPNMQFVCNVGCCYHHLHEEFYCNPYMSEEEMSARQASPRFPLSQYLRDKKFELGKNALMVAAQPMDRLLANLPLPSESLLWRAILQVLLKRHKPDLKFEDQHVGRIAKKSDSFVNYVHKSFDKLCIKLEISDEEIEQVYQTFARSHRQKLIGYYQLKSMLGPAIEGLILLDRLLWLAENKDVNDAYLVKMFDAVVSPRCYSIVATKM